MWSPEICFQRLLLHFTVSRRNLLDKCVNESQQRTFLFQTWLLTAFSRANPRKLIKKFFMYITIDQILLSPSPSVYIHQLSCSSHCHYKKKVCVWVCECVRAQAQASGQALTSERPAVWSCHRGVTAVPISNWDSSALAGISGSWLALSVTPGNTHCLTSSGAATGFIETDTGTTCAASRVRCSAFN